MTRFRVPDSLLGLPFRALVTLAVLTVLLGAGASRPAAQDTQTPVFRGGVDLLSLDVSVVDGDGHPIPGLTAADFTVKVEGQHLPVRTVDFMEFGTSGGSEASGPGAVTTNRSAAPGAERRGGRVIVLLIDDLSERPGEGTDVRVAAERFLTTLDPDDLVGLTSTSGFGPVVSPTRNRLAVLSALSSPSILGRYDDSLVSPFYLSILETLACQQDSPSDPTCKMAVHRECSLAGYAGDQSCPDRLMGMAKAAAREVGPRAAAQIAAYRDVIEALRVAPQPRVLVALTHGIALPDTMHPNQALDTIAHAAADADVRFYAIVNFVDPVDIRALGPGGLPPYDRRSVRQAEAGYLLDGIGSITHETGGEAFSAIGQADRFFTRIKTETSGLYQLGVPLPSSLASHTYLNVEVSVSRPHVSVHAVPHALAPGSAPKPASIDETMRMRLAQGGVAFGVPITLGTALRKDPGDARVQVGVDVEMPATVDGPLTAMFAVIDALGRTVQAGRSTVAPPPDHAGYHLSWGIPVVEGPYRLRFTVADVHGNVGSVERAVVAHLNQFGAMRTSDLLMAWEAPGRRPQFLALGLLPATATTFRAALELYPEASTEATALGVRFRLLQTEDPLHPTVITENQVVPSTSNGPLTAATALPAQSIVSGSYTIEATVLSGGQVVGIVKDAFRKTP